MKSLMMGNIFYQQFKSAVWKYEMKEISIEMRGV